MGIFGAAGQSRRNSVWVVVAALLAATTMAGTVYAVGVEADTAAQKERNEFESSSAEVVSALQSAIQHEEDLILSGAAYLAGNPEGSNAEFVQWSESIQALKRYPELHDFGNALIVPASELGAFAARAEADPWAALGPSGKFQVEPAGSREFYCLGSVGQVRDEEVGAPAGQDYCATGLGPALFAARDTGTSSYDPYTVGTDLVLGISTPYYRGGSVPATVEERRAAFLGWFGMTMMPLVLLDRALQAHPEMSVEFRYQRASSQAEFSAGTPAPGAQTATTDLDNGWTVQTYGAVPDGALANGQLLVLLIGGALVSLLLGVLVFVLGTSRGRALRLVQERTAELRGAQAQLVDSARQAGMAEMATNVLHNVGNVLNSVNVSANLLSQKVRGSKSAGLSKAVALMEEHAGDLGGFLTTDARGRALPGYLDKLATTLTAERESLEEELLRLTNAVAHIKDIVSAQQSLAGVSGVIESVRVSDLLEDALLMAGVRGDSGLAVTLEIPEDDPLLSMDRHRVLLVLLNLLGNAMHAMKRNTGRPRQLSLRAEVKAGQLMSITVADNGAGIPQENLTRIFVHGFTTRADGHGFGLHSSAMAAQEMGGELTVHSDGVDHGAVFTLEVPLTAQAVLV